MKYSCFLLCQLIVVTFFSIIGCFDAGAKLQLQQPVTVRAGKDKTEVFLLESGSNLRLSYQSLKDGGIEITIPKDIKETVEPRTIKMLHVT